MTAAARIAALDVGRTLAVIGLIAVHLAPWMVTSPVWLDTLANLSQYGVQCFFVISAITISASLQHDAQRLSGTREVLRNFYVISPMSSATSSSFMRGFRRRSTVSCRAAGPLPSRCFST
jgi:peptidoglycan/LPS O-acetylase OafA/YrhL